MVPTKDFKTALKAKSLATLHRFLNMYPRFRSVDDNLTPVLSNPPTQGATPAPTPVKSESSTRYRFVVVTAEPPQMTPIGWKSELAKLKKKVSKKLSEKEIGRAHV